MRWLPKEIAWMLHLGLAQGQMETPSALTYCCGQHVDVITDCLLINDKGEGKGGGNQENDGGCSDISGGGGILEYLGPL